MQSRNRREFLANVGKGMLIASVGPAMAAELGGPLVLAGEESGKKLSFGAREPLVALMQETTAPKLLPLLLARLNAGLTLGDLVAAGALANARTFGGQNYDGYHAFMALAPAFHMAQELPKEQQALPVFKVLYRNTQFMQRHGGRDNEALHALEHANAEIPTNEDAIRQATRRADIAAAERSFAALANDSVGDAFNQVQLCVQDDIDVHRVVLAWRAWATLDLTGRESASTLLRQSVRYCIDTERSLIKNKRPQPGVRAALPKLLDKYKLLGRSLGNRKADDAWIAKMCQTIYEGNHEQAAEAVAAALAEGFGPEDLGEAVSLAANRLVLRDPGRTRADNGKPIGSIHGASVGVHASDSANAWRNIARASNARNRIASLIVAGYHTAGQAGHASGNPYPWDEHLSAVKAKDASGLLAETEEAIKARDQGRACAAVQRYAELGFEAKPVFEVMLRYACSEDGALHAEKYYRTVVEEFAVARPAFRWRHLVGLARVTASECGFPRPDMPKPASY